MTDKERLLAVTDKEWLLTVTDRAWLLAATDGAQRLTWSRYHEHVRDIKQDWKFRTGMDTHLVKE